MNILYDLQLSVLTSLDDGDFIFETDSNVNVARFTIKGLLRKDKNIKFFVLVPPLKKIKAYKEGKITHISDFMKELKSEDRVTFVEYPYYGNPFVDRMSFNSNALRTALQKTCYDSGNRIDVVYTNDPNKVMSYKTFFYKQQNEFLPIISRNHWVTGRMHRKVPIEIDFIIRQIEGALNSECSTFNSKVAMEMLLENSKEHFNDEVRDTLKKKSKYIETVDIEKIDTFALTDKIDNESSIFTILWGHRLSYYTGWEETFEVLNNIHKKGVIFQLIAPDPGNKFKQTDLKEKYPFLKVIDKENWTHEDYMKACWEADLVIGNHNIPTTWGGLALTEPMAALTVPIMPKKDGYLEMFYKDQDAHNIFFESKKELEELIEMYIKDKNLLSRMKVKARRFCEEALSMERYINTIYSIIIKANNKIEYARNN